MARERDIEDILEGKAEKFRERVEENVGKIRDRVEENVGKIRDRVDEAREQFDEVKEKGEEAWKDVTKYTQKHPGKALGVAMLVGAALGVILFGRNRD